MDCDRTFYHGMRIRQVISFCGSVTGQESSLVGFFYEYITINMHSQWRRTGEMVPEMMQNDRISEKWDKEVPCQLAEATVASQILTPWSD